MNNNLFRRSLKWAGTLLGFVFALPLLALGHDLTRSQADELWTSLRTELRSSPANAFDDGSIELPRYPGFITSNESGYITLGDLPAGAATQVGVANLPSLTIAAMRNPRELVLFDHSYEVIIAMRSIWRPLILASPSSSDFFRLLSGIPVARADSRNSPLDYLLEARRAPLESDYPRVFEELLPRLQQLRDEGFVSETDIRLLGGFFSDQQTTWFELVSGRASGVSRSGFSHQSIFRNSTGVRFLPQALISLFQPETFMSYASQAGLFTPGQSVQAAAAYQRFVNQSSLMNNDRFLTLQRLFRERRDHYAVADIRDSRLWNRLSERAQETGRPITDLYVSNVPLAALGDTAPQVRAQIAAELAEGAGREVRYYETLPHPPYLIAQKTSSRTDLLAFRRVRCQALLQGRDAESPFQIPQLR